jgi:GT2 family glycosyltransferase
VIVLNWNGLRFLGPCMSSLMNQTMSEHEVILVDNSSDDGSVEYVRRNFPLVRIVENDANLGFAEGNNVGLRSASGDYLVVLNNDTRVSPNFIEVLVNCASSDPEAGSVGCRIIQEDGSFRYGPCYANMTYLVPLFMGSKFLPERLGRLFCEEGQCATNCATAVLYTRRALEAVGGFDADFWSDWEDHDLGLRISLAGYKNLYTTKTHVLHVGAGSFGDELSKKRYVRIVRNILFTYIKNYEASNLATWFFLLFWVILPIRHVLLIISGELAPLTWRFSQDTTVVSRRVYAALPEAYISFLQGLATTMRKRAKVQAHRKVSDSIIFSTTRRRWVV